MLNSKEEQIFAPRSTCTKDEAVARLLGWMKGPAYPRNIPFGPYGVPTAQYVNLQFLEGSIQNELTIYRETARQEWISASASRVNDAGKSAEVLLDCYDLAAKAEKYLIEISDEIAKGDASALRIDREATSAEQETHYTLKSVEEWAMKTLGLSVIQANVFDMVQEVAPLTTEIDEDAEEESTPEADKGLGKIKANNLYIAFALLVEDFSKSNSGYTTKAGDSIEDAIAQHIENLGTAANKGHAISGLRSEAIRKNIAEAMKRKAKKLNDG